MKEKKIEFIAHAVRWFDKVNGNTYHSVRIERVKDGAILKSSPIIYGYGDHYRQTAIDLMIENNWIPSKYGKKQTNGGNLGYMFERENGYPIYWDVRDGLKREMKANVS